MLPENNWKGYHHTSRELVSPHAPPTPRTTHLNSNLVVTSVLGLGTAFAGALALGTRALAGLSRAVALGQSLVWCWQGVDVHLLGAGDTALAAAGAGALAGGTLAAAGICLAVAGGLVRVGLWEVVDVHVLTAAAAALLFLLEIGEVSCLIVDVHDGLVALFIEATELLSGRGVGGLLEIR
jgi:hypothetical protein